LHQRPKSLDGKLLVRPVVILPRCVVVVDIPEVQTSILDPPAKLTFLLLLLLHRKLNTSPSKVEDQEVLKKLLCNPPIKKIDLHFPLGLEVTARNSKGVTIKDALDAIHKQFKKKVTSEPQNTQTCTPFDIPR